MKRSAQRLFSGILIIAMVFSLVACNSSSSTTSSTANSASTNTANSTSDNEATAQAELTTIDFPTKEITLIVPWAAGGAADLFAREMQSVIKQTQGIDIVVQVMEGGAGVIGTSEALTSKPDGYTVGYITSTWLAQLSAGTVPYTIDSHSVVSTMFEELYCFCVRKDSPYEDAVALMDDIKANPGKLQVGHPGSGNVPHILINIMGDIVESNVKAISYDGGSRVMTEILGGHIDGGLLKPVECSGQVEAGELKVLAVFGDERIKVFGDVPTFIELGYDIYSYGNVVQTVFLAVPPETDLAVQERLGEIFSQALMSDQFQEYCDKNGVSCTPKVGSEANTYIKDVAEGIDALLKAMAA